MRDDAGGQMRIERRVKPGRRGLIGPKPTSQSPKADHATLKSHHIGLQTSDMFTEQIGHQASKTNERPSALHREKPPTGFPVL